MQYSVVKWSLVSLYLISEKNVHRHSQYTDTKIHIFLLAR